MSTATAVPETLQLPRWREVVWPKEHGSWSLALEPLALGLLVAPSFGGAAFAVAVLAAFFARRPLRIAFADKRAERRLAAKRAVIGCGAVALTAWFTALSMEGVAWLPWLIPSAVAGAAFLWFDLQSAGREQAAEIVGSVAFAWLPAVFAMLGGRSSAMAIAIGLVMLARSLPTVLTVRATVRARKTGTRTIALPLTAAVVVALGTFGLSHAALAPWTAFVAVLILAARSFVLVVFPRPALRASTIGMIEVALGIAYVVGVAIAW